MYIVYTLCLHMVLYILCYILCYIVLYTHCVYTLCYIHNVQAQGFWSCILLLSGVNYVIQSQCSCFSIFRILSFSISNLFLINVCTRLIQKQPYSRKVNIWRTLKIQQGSAGYQVRESQGCTNTFSDTMWSSCSRYDLWPRVYSFVDSKFLT